MRTNEAVKKEFHAKKGKKKIKLFSSLGVGAAAIAESRGVASSRHDMEKHVEMTP